MKKQLIALTAAAALSVGVASQASAANTVTVEWGNTLWGISQANDVTVSQLKDWNDLSSNLIYPNQKLVVEPTGTEKASQPAAKEQSSASTYTVVSGDTLYRIASKHGISLDNLMSWNGLTSHWIYPGDKLTVSGGTAVKGVSSSAPQKVEAAPAPAPAKESSSDVVRELTVEATAYTAFCTGCSGITYTGIDLRSNPNQKVIAVDPRVIPLGSKVWVEGYGTAIAGDIGGAIKGNRIDVFIPNRSDALAWGRQNVTVKILN
ncbi:LysM peptidoglycan-binding and 3D domain-containing protein [Planococcus lenghuensis]|uniref:Peptidoglycan-binding protein n=1 Tax=Planococcus lenghuensis TaxID=2213202 RepID=A0A1Q2KV54_9BACL|nr:3D domain-containing protein [Planococcus lenghuensis]AQQ52006.1 peptidoglycan-binding protein [Planococcus lenghuensis]